MLGEVISTAGPKHVDCCDSYNFMAKFNYSSRTICHVVVFYIHKMSSDIWKLHLCLLSYFGVFVQFIICLVSCALYKVEFIRTLYTVLNEIFFKYWENKIKNDLKWCSFILIFLKFIRIFVCFRSNKFYNKNTIMSKKRCTKQVSMTFSHVRKEWCTVYITWEGR